MTDKPIEEVWKAVDEALAAWQQHFQAMPETWAKPLAKARDILKNVCGEIVSAGEELSRRTENLQMELQTARQAFQRLGEDLAKAVELGASKERAAAQKEESLRAVEQRVADAERATAEREAALEAAKQRITQLEQSFVERGEASEAARRRVADLEKQLAEQDDANKSLREKVATIEKELAEQKASFQATQERLTDSEKELAKSRAEIEKTSAALENVTKSSQSEISRLKGELAQHKSAAQTTQEQLANMDKKLADLQAELDRVRGERDANQAAVEKLAEAKAELQAERERALELEERLREETARGTKTALAQQLAEALQAREELHTELLRLRKEAERLRLKSHEAGRAASASATPSTGARAEESADFDRLGKKRQIGELLVEAGSITQEQLEIALEEQRKSPNRHLGAIIVDLQFTSEEVVAKALAAQCNVSFVRMNEKTVNESAARLISGRLASLHSCLPISATEKKLVLAMVNPFNLIAIEDVERATNRHVEPVVATPSEIRAAIDRVYAAASA